MMPWRKLKELGVLGINQRNLDFVLRHNPRRLYPFVDDKVRTKSMAAFEKIPAPALYGIVEIEHQVRELEPLFEKHKDFVIKPAHGAGGDGILVIAGQMQNRYRKVNGTLLKLDEVKHHVSNILSGVYSLAGLRDKAMIEYRVQFHPLFEAISYQGIPDVRIIVLLGYPIMAMVRLPTRQSDAKANLHQGAVGVGIDLATGITGTGVWFNEVIDTHPDTGNPVSGLKIPNWGQFLSIASRCHELTGLGYLGVDIVLDKAKGPLMLELNARPGLNIQIANKCGLLNRSKIIEKEAENLRTVQQKIDFSQTHFSNPLME